MGLLRSWGTMENVVYCHKMIVCSNKKFMSLVCTIKNRLLTTGDVHSILVILQHVKNSHTLGQGCELHVFVSTGAPSLEQSFPPFIGAGLVHVLALCCIPPPQVAEHSSQALQSV